MDEFAIYLGKTGKAQVEPAAHGFNIFYLEKDPELLARQQKELKERQNLRKEEDRMLQEIEARRKQIEESTTKPIEAPTEVDLDKAKEIKFSLGPSIVKPKPTTPITTTTTSPSEIVLTENSTPITFTKGQKFQWNFKIDIFIESENDDSKKRKTTESSEKIPVTSESSKKVKSTKSAVWITEGIVVKVMNKQVGDGKYYKQKGYIEKLVSSNVALVKMIDSGSVLKLDQSQLETVIPSIGGKVKIVNREYTGQIATMIGINMDKFAVEVKLDNGVTLWKDYEDVSKLYWYPIFFSSVNIICKFINSK